MSVAGEQSGSPLEVLLEAVVVVVVDNWHVQVL